MARGVVAELEPLDGDADDAPVVSLEVPEAPLVLPALGDALLGDALLGEVVLGEVVLGVMLLGDVLVLLDASAGVVLLGVVVLAPDVLDPLLDVGWLRLTSPVEVPVTLPFGDALLLGTQSVVVEELDDVAAVDGEDMLLGVVLEVAALPLADARLAESALVDGVTPVPLAPFVVLRPVKRWSGFVAGLRVESVAALVVDVELGLIVVADE